MTKSAFLRTGARAHLGAAGRHLWLALRHAARALRVVAGHLIAAPLAVLVVFLEWGWKPLAALLGRIAVLRPIAALEAAIQKLPPYAALAVFALPSVVLFPLKLFSFWLVAKGYVVSAAAMFVAAKVVGTALLARLWMLTSTQLQQIGWFKRCYDWAMPKKAALIAWVRESAVWRRGRIIKARVKRTVAPMMAALTARLRAIRLRSFGR